MATAEREREFLTIAAAADLLDVAPITIRRRIDSGDLPAVQLGGRGTCIRIPRRALDAWLWSKPREAA